MNYQVLHLHHQQNIHVKHEHKSIIKKSSSMVLNGTPTQRADSSINTDTSTSDSNGKHSRCGGHAHQSTIPNQYG